MVTGNMGGGDVITHCVESHWSDSTLVTLATVGIANQLECWGRWSGRHSGVQR